MCMTSAEKSLTKEERKQCFEDYLASGCFPSCFCIFMASLMTLHGILFFVFGILALVYKTPLGYIGAGIWVGTVIIIAQIAMGIFLFKRTRTTYLIQQILLAASLFFLVATYVTCNLNRKENPHKWIEQALLGFTYSYQSLGIITFATLGYCHFKAYSRYLNKGTGDSNCCKQNKC